MAEAPVFLGDFAPDARDALREAARLARSYGRTFAEPVHLLLALLRGSREAVEIIDALTRERGRIEDLASELFKRDAEPEGSFVSFSDVAAQSSGGSDEIGLAGSTQRVLEAARTLTPERSDGLIHDRHLLFGLAYDPDIAGAVLRPLGVNDVAIAEVVQRRLAAASGESAAAAPSIAGAQASEAVAAPDKRDTRAKGGATKRRTRHEVGTQSPFSAHRDLPAGWDADHLDFRKYVDAMSDMIRHSAPPLTIGILGTWGSGKSSMMKMIEDRLQGRDRNPEVRVVCVKFNAWQHTDAAKVWSVLVRDVLHELEKRAGFVGRLRFIATRGWASGYRMVRTRALPFAAAVATGAVLLALNGFFPDLLPQNATVAVAGGSGLSATLLFFELVKASRTPASQQVARFFAETDLHREPDYLSEIERDMKTLTELIGAPQTASRRSTVDRVLRVIGFGRQAPFRVVIFIDDLDRCLPDQAVDVLEAVKLVLNQELFVTFIGVDTRVLAKAVENRYGDVLPESLHAGGPGMEYLEKIIQLPFYIANTDLRGYLRSLVEPNPVAWRVDADEVITPQFSDADVGAGWVRPGRVESPERVQAPLTNPVALTPQDGELLARYVEYLADNPRGVNRLVNLYRFAKSLGRPETLAETTLQWLILADRWPDFTAFAAARLMAMGPKARTRKQWLAMISEFEQRMPAALTSDEDRARFERRRPGEFALLRRFMERTPTLRTSEFSIVRPFIVNISPARLMELSFATAVDSMPRTAEPQRLGDGAIPVQLSHAT